MNSLEYIFGSLAFITSFIGLIPQSIKSLQTRSTGDLSIVMLVNYAICSFSWIIYGWIIGSSFVLFSNVVGLVTVFILMMQKWRYDAEKSS
jgi:MtN3 and saliva related transmembrane protein